MNKISAVIIAKNNENDIKRCLTSLKDVADEIIVVDAFSQDRTPEISKKLGATVYQIEWHGYSRNKNYGNQKASHDFILSIDSDEALSPELAAAIIAAKPDLGSLYTFNRRTNYCGKWIRHCGWYPDVKLRLFDRRVAQWEGDFVHEQLQFDPKIPVQHLSGDLLHYSFNSISDHIKRLDRYSTLAAQDIVRKNKRVPLWEIVISPLVKFLKTYFLKLGVLDGFYGFCISIISGVDVFIRYAKVREAYLAQYNKARPESNL